MSPLRLLLFILALLSLSVLQSAPLRAQPLKALGENPRVLLLHSYHQGLPWTDSVHQGFVAGLGARAQSSVLFVEYMDALRIPLLPVGADSGFAEQLVQRYRGRGIDILLATDAAALRLLLAHRERIAPGKPLLFAGANNFREEHLLGLENLAGVVETPDFAANISLMQHLHRRNGNAANSVAARASVAHRPVAKSVAKAGPVQIAVAKPAATPKGAAGGDEDWETF
ncbi:MAG TPA: hypothetical protein PLL01_16635 [Rhodoferax sp.]|jgi:hypothetical protein|nr:hypothetical protein [Rhodoferax sp.]HPW31012.1 hypothetical protein [Rhodoferax sp.]